MTATESPPVSSGRLSLAVTAPRPATVHQSAAPASEAPAPAAAARKARRRRPPLTLRDWVWRTVAWCLLAGSVGLLLWTYRELVPAQQSLRDASSRVSRLSAEIAVMEGRYSPADIEQLAAEYRGAIDLLFSTPESLAEWLQEIRAHAVPLAFDTTPEFSRLTPEAQGRTNVVSAYEPATLSLVIQPKVQVEGVRPAYERLLRFLGELGRQSKRVDLVELQVHGGSNSVSHAVATLKFWVGAEVDP